MVKLFRMYSNLCDHNPRTLQTDGQTTCNRNTALCTKVHRAVKTVRNQMKWQPACAEWWEILKLVASPQVLENWMKPPGWRLFIRTWNPATSPWMKQLMWLKIVQSGDWFLHLALCIPTGAWQEWLNEWILLHNAFKSNIMMFLQLKYVPQNTVAFMQCHQAIKIEKSFLISCYQQFTHKHLTLQLCAKNKNNNSFNKKSTKFMAIIK